MSRCIGNLTYRLLATLLVASAVILVPESWAAAAGLRLIRDAEIEHTLRMFATPIFKAANIAPDSIHIYLVNDPEVNSFAAAGPSIFINTGLILATETPGQLIGVIGHETGHIAGGHIVRGSKAMKTAMLETVASMLIGVAAAVVGNGDAGAAVMTSGPALAERQYLGVRRVEESSADAAAVTFLTRAHESARGLLQFLQILNQRETIMMGRLDPYLLDHPLTPERIAALQNRARRSPYYHTPFPASYEMPYERMKAKLAGFLDPLDETMRLYPPGDQEIPALYARAIAYYREPDLKKALSLIDELLAERPRDPYFLELKGQMLLDNDHVAQSVRYYREAVHAAPNEPLLRSELGVAEVQSDNPALLKSAISNLELATQIDGNDPSMWYHLSVAYGRANEIPLAQFAAAERSFLLGDYANAKFLAKSALARLPPNSSAALRAGDIQTEAEHRLKKQQQD